MMREPSISREVCWAAREAPYLQVIVGVLIYSFMNRTIIREVLNWPLSKRKPPNVMPSEKAHKSPS